MKRHALVWFTGVISQYNVSEHYNVKGLNLNKGILSRIRSKYDVTFLIYVKDEDEKNAYLHLLTTNKITDIPVVFASYDTSFHEILYEFSMKYPEFILIDYSKKRLIDASRYLGRVDMMHISSLLD